MKYRLNTTNYHTFSVYEVNKLHPRSYFIPYPTRRQADAVSLLQKRYQSPKVTCLNGTWDFKFYPRPAQLPEVLDTDTVSFDSLDVPSCWQFRGYDRPFYVNIRYQFPYAPPAIPTTERAGKVFSWTGCDQGISLRWKDPGEEYNFVGVYRRFVTIQEECKNYILSFLGVASCFDLYLNGEFIGYSEGAHNTAEFDLLGKLRSGQNELVVVVHRWCNGTYLEGQDMFRNNGIFRDVLLRESEASDLWDIDIKTQKIGKTYMLTVKAQTFAETKVVFTLEGHGIHQTFPVLTENKIAEVVFDALDVQEWNAEQPNLYSLYIETPSGCVKEQIGFRTVEIKGDVFLLNGRKLKLHGVNHHDTSPRNGYTLSPEEIERDVELCKAYNIDTVRTAHYPPDPLLLELADERGLYIVDENDLETHGTFAHQLPPTYNSISNDPKWKAYYLDRITRLYHRDKLHPSIVMWSLGNEAGGYSNTDAMYDFLKAHSDLPVHYESAIHCKRQAYDVGSEMYPSVKMVHDVGEKCRRQKRLNDRPYFMCEYAHAMGVGPGNTEAYWKEIYQYDSLMGGCVWEMFDHAVLHPDGNYTYGGDHGEWEHDKNFCVDGLFYPDRTPSTGAELIRFIYRPIRVRHLGGADVEIFNTTGFSQGTNYRLDFLWNDGSTFILSPDVRPLEKKVFHIPQGKAAHGTLSLIVSTTDLRTNCTVSEEQVVLQQQVQKQPQTFPLPAGYALEHNKFVFWQGGETVLQEAEQSTLLYRAATDNDTDLLFRNTMKPYEEQEETVLRTERLPNGLRVVTQIKNRKNRFVVTDTYEGTDKGVLVTSHLHCVSGRGILPRFGKCFRLDKAFDIVTYTGRCGESYADMKEQFPVKTMRSTVAEMVEPNIRPQESGNRCDCVTASVSNGHTTVSFEAVGRPFELGIKPYTDRALCGMKHRKDEVRTGTYVTIQAFQQGIGTGACGPAIMPEYQFKAQNDYTLQFLIRVENAESEETL